jgi:predicted RNase H-like nuclease (RuvC/YqgF family)
MRITHIRLRALRSHEHGYGHDAAEIEAALDPGDDPDEVAQRARQRMEDELRQGVEGKRLVCTLDDLRAEVRQLEDRRRALEDELETLKDIAEKCKAFLAAAKEKGLELPHELSSVGIPF